MSSLVERIRSQSSQSTHSKMGPGKALSVYDGRAWPVVKCGAVYITDEDKTKKVTKNVVSLSAGPDDSKKKSSSKYTLAIGSSFGHIHSFLKDSDHVLRGYEKTKAEDKCLLLIKKPKSASKQMLKAHSWANLSGPDMQQRLWDGSLKQEQTYKRKHPDLSLPPEDSQQPSSSNQNAPYKGHSANQSSSFKSLSSVSEQERTSNSDGKPDKRGQNSGKPVQQNKQISQSSQNLLNSYPLDNRSNQLQSIERQKSVSSVDLRQGAGEINNNRMGGVLGHGHSRPKGPPPKVPDRKSGPSEFDTRNNNGGVNSQTRSAKQPLQRQSSDTKLNRRDSGGFIDNQPDLIPNVQSGRRKGVSGNMSDDSNGHRMNYARMKHDSGFISEAPISSDDLYDSGFKQELSVSSQNGHHITSSPKTSRNNSDKRDRNINVVRGDNGQRNGGYDNRNTNGYNNERRNMDNASMQPRVAYDMNNSTGRHVRSMDNMHIPSNGYPVNTEHNLHNFQTVENQRNVTNRPVQRNHSDKNIPKSVHSVNTNYAKSEQTVTHGNHGNNHYGNHYHRNEQQQRPRSSENPGHRSETKDQKQRKSLGNVKEEQSFSMENKQPVIKTKSLGDLSQGCTFSLVGQKKTEMIPSNFQNQPNGSEFTGTQMMKHIRKYRDISQKGSNGGSLPFRGKAVDDMDTYTYRNYQNIPQPQVPPSNMNNAARAMHYGSLQHLPISSSDGQYQNGQKQTTKVAPVRKREQTPMKPRRSLPQTPADAHEKKKQMSDLVKNRVSAGSRSSTTSPSSSNSNSGGSTEMRPGGISATPSDREVCALLQSNRSEVAWKTPAHPLSMCINNADNTNINKIQPGHHGSGSQNTFYHSNSESNNLRKSGSFGSHDHGTMVPPGGRLSESGQTTLTSQSTIDSGYVTTDADHETLSTSSYAKSLQQSAQNLFKRHSQKGETPVQQSAAQQPTKIQSKGDHSNYPKGSHSSEKFVKDSHAHTKTWLENHPGTFMNDHYKMSLNSQEPSHGKNTDPKRDTNNNRHGEIHEDRVTELGLTQNEIQKQHKHSLHGQKQTSLSHHVSELTMKDIERLNSENGQFMSKGKSISMSQGLNLIASNSTPNNGPNPLSKSQPKFTGSLKDLIGIDKQIVPIETLRLESAPSTSTLPGNWKFHGPNRPESSLKLFGKPSLFQLLQNYNLYAVRIKIPEKFVITENMRMIECEVVLPSPWIYGKDAAAMLSPKGSYAKLGGPNSAFKPVVGGNTTPIKSVSMVTVMDLSNEISTLLEPGQLQKGDLIVEVNERLMMGEDLPTLVAMLQGCHGELLLTLARDKARIQQQDRDLPTDEDFRLMEQKINQLTTELQKKDRTVKQLNELFQWKRNATKGSNSEQEGYLCSLSDDEFIV